MYILFDIGGTNIRVAASEDLQTYSEPIKFKNPQTYAAGLEAIIEAARKLSDGKQVTALAGGIRGRLKKDKSRITGDVILVDWENKPLVADLSSAFDAPAFLENDSAIVGLGETSFGGGKGHNIVAYLTVSTGVGGARYVDGHLDVTSIGFEPGHQIIDLDRSLFGEEIPHTLENFVSGKAVEKRRLTKPYDIPQADGIWDELAGYLAIGLHNTILYWSPDAIVLGGSMIVGDPCIEMDAIRAKTESYLDGFVACPDIVKAELGDDGGLYGAMQLINLQQIT